MRKRYLQSANQGLLSGARLWAAVVGGILLVLLGVRLIVPDVFIAISNPFWSAGNGISAAVGYLIPEEPSRVREERDTLTRERDRLTEELAVARARITDLERLVGADEAADPGIPAGVLVRPPVTPYDMLVVDAGAREGVRVGAGVYGPGGAPVGTIALVSPENAHVSFFSAAGRVTEGWLGEARTPITLTGAGAGAFYATASKDAAIAIGTNVYVPGPGALPIGTVERVDTNPSTPVATVYVRPLVNPFTVTWVTIGDVLP